MMNIPWPLFAWREALLEDLVHHPSDHIEIRINQSTYQPYIDDALCPSFCSLVRWVKAAFACTKASHQNLEGCASTWSSPGCFKVVLLSSLYRSSIRCPRFSHMFPSFFVLFVTASDACCRSSFRPLVKVLASFKASSAAWNPRPKMFQPLRWRKWLQDGERWWKKWNQEAQMICQQRRFIDDLYKLTTIYCTSCYILFKICAWSLRSKSSLVASAPVKFRNHFQMLGASCLCIAAADFSTAIFGCEWTFLCLYTNE